MFVPELRSFEVKDRTDVNSNWMPVIGWMYREGMVWPVSIDAQEYIRMLSPGKAQVRRKS